MLPILSEVRGFSSNYKDHEYRNDEHEYSKSMSDGKLFLFSNPDQWCEDQDAQKAPQPIRDLNVLSFCKRNLTGHFSKILYDKVNVRHHDSYLTEADNEVAEVSAPITKELKTDVRKRARVYSFSSLQDLLRTHYC